MAQHTQGPWKIEQSPDLLDDERLESADVTAPVPGTSYKTFVARVYCENRKGATVGPNARLIAAAPDLYDLIWGIAMYPDIRKHVAEKFPGLVEKAQALVAEIEGGA